MKFGRLLFLSAEPALVREQLAGRALTRAQAGALRDDISTDEISPLPAMVHFDATLGRFAHTGFTAGIAESFERMCFERMYRQNADNLGLFTMTDLGLVERPRIDIAYGRSCTAGKRENFEQYHAVLAWAAARHPTNRR